MLFKNRIKKNKIATAVTAGAIFGYLINDIRNDKSNSRQEETELVVTREDARRMLEEDSIGVYHTEYGPVFTAMSKETLANES